MIEENKPRFTKTESTWLQEYWKCIQQGYMILDGKKTPLIVGEEMRTIVRKLINDLEDPRYIYNTNESDKRIAFKETCVMQTKSPYYGKKLQLTLPQKAMWEAIYSFKMKETGNMRFTKVLYLVARKAGKGNKIDTPIPTPNGYTTMGDLKVGDYIFDREGKPTKVLWKTDIQNNEECYEVEFEDGEVVTVSSSHLWTVMTKTSRKTLKYKCKSNRKLLRPDYRENNGYFVIDTETMLKDFVRVRADGKGKEYKYRVPMNQPAQYSKKELPIDPYLLGLWLGDGNHDDHKLCINSKDLDHILKELEKRSIKVKYAKKEKGKNCYIISFIHEKDKPLYSYYLNVLRELNLYKNKHIPRIYLESSIEQRMDLLKGLMDTDGHVSKAGEIEFTQNRLHLINEVSELLSSLGIKNKVKKKIAKLNGKEFKAYRISFFTDKTRPCFTLPRQIERLKEKLADRMLNKSIIDIRNVGKQKWQCIKVDNEEELYLCGNKYTVTHNSTDIASDGCYDLFLGEAGRDICVTSFDDATAKLVWQEIARMRQLLDTKNELTRHNLVEIRNDKKNITIFRMSSKTGSKDGRNIDKNYYDEAWVDKTSEIHDAVYQSMSVKNEPLMIIITTEGTTNDGFLDNELSYARSVLNDEIDDIHYLPWLFTQDSETEVFQDRWSWCKSNPGLIYGIKKWEFLDNQMLKAQHQKSARVTMLCKDFNIKQSSANAWLNYSDVMYEQEELTLNDFRGCYCIAGVDLSQTLDLSCVSLMFMKKDSDKKYIFNKYFIPETKLGTDETAGAKYREWQQKGYIEVHKGSEVNLTKVAEYFKWLADTYQIFCFKIGYDNKFAHDWLSVMDGYGYKSGKNQSCELIVQNRYVLSTPMKTLEADLINRTIQGLTEMDRWCLMNVAMDIDNKEMIMPVKIKTEGRIDGAAAMIICNAMHFRCANDFRTMVENR